MFEEIQNGAEVEFENVNMSFAVLRKNKDNWGNVTGLRVVSKSGTEYDVVEHNGDICLAESGVCALKPVGRVEKSGSAEWFNYGVGGYTVN